MSDYDQAARYAARQLDAEGFLRWLLPKVFAAWEWGGWLETESVPFPGEPARRSDTVAWFRHRQGDAPPAAAVIEFQARPVGVMPARLAEYALRLHRELPYQRDPLVPFVAVGVVVNLTGPAQADAWSLAPPDFGELGLWSRCGVRTLRGEDAAVTLAAIEAGQTARCILPWIPLMKGGDRAAVIQEWLRLASAEHEPRRRGDYAGLALVFAGLAGCRDVWDASLEGWGVEVSEVVERWREQGRAEGVAAMRDTLLQFLRSRFVAELPMDLVSAVQNQSSLAILKRWFDQALTVASLEEMRTAILGASSGS